MVVWETLSDELLAAIWYLGLSREDHFAGIQDGLVFEDWLLWLVVSEWLLTEDQFEEDNSNWPYINFMRYVRTVLLEALWSLIPICSDSLWGELYLLIAFINYLAKAEVSYLHFTVVEDDVLWFEVVMNDFLFAII